MAEENRPISHVYIHFPFCKSKCGYCSFYSIVSTSGKIEEYLNLLQQRIMWYSNNFKIKAKTIYFGGGTPSMIKFAHLRSIINKIDKESDCEITLEANPADVTADTASAWREAGINRVSMGWQSMQQQELDFLGRRQTVEDNYRAVEVLREIGIENISLDLIYGLPGQKVIDVQKSLDKYLIVEPEHISTYCLTLDEDCRLCSWKKRLPEDSLLSEMYHSIRDQLCKSDYCHYELSNFGKAGKESRHNMAYWQDEYYLGIGASASGYLPGYRYKNCADVRKWQESVQSGRIESEKDIIGEKEREAEYIILALRLIKGLNLRSYYHKFGKEFEREYGEVLARFQKLKLLEIKGNYVRLTPKGYFVCNEIFCEFI